tara:strand:- start:254 stop:2119 length:1866 start_codon:yes stop_codon:yes gene_type:complete
MLKNRGNIFLIIFVIVASCYSVIQAEAPKVSTWINQNEILLGDSVILTVKVDGISNPEAPKIPDIPHFSVRFLGKQQESYSSYTVIINGKKVEDKTSRSGVQFNYELTPKKEGTLTIPEFSITINGQLYQFNTFKIKVLNQNTEHEDLFIKQSIDRHVYFLGEQITVHFKWYLKQDVNDYKLKIPWLEGVDNSVISDIDPDKNKTYQAIIVNGNKQVPALKTQEIVNGKKYTVFSIKKIVTPISEGTYKLEPAFLKYSVIKGYRQSRNAAFDHFFNTNRNAILDSFSARSDAILITVKHPPHHNRPASFTGAVGDIDFNVSVSPQTVNVGDPITVTMKLSGTGNIGQVKMPQLPHLPEFKQYEPAIKFNKHTQGDKVISEKIVEKVLIPRVNGIYKIDKIDFTFFNPQKRKFQTVSKGPFNLNINESDTEGRSYPIAIQDNQVNHNPERFQKNIRYIKTELGAISTVEKQYSKYRIGWILGYLIPLCLLPIFYIVRKRQLLLQTDLKFLRNTRATKRSRSFMLSAKKAIETKNGTQFYQEINNALSNYLADKLNVPVARVTSGITHTLKEKGVDPALIKEIDVLFQSIEMSLFSSAEFNDTQIQSDFEKVKQIIKQLKREL